GGWLSLALARGGRVPVQVATGCDRGCWHCVEPCATGRVVAQRPVAEVLAEVDALARAGVRRLWLACSELNVPDARHAIALLRALGGRGLDLRCYLQPAPVDAALLDAMEDAGIDPSGISFEFGHLAPEVLAAGGGPAPRAALDRLLETWLRRGYRGLGATVLFGAHPAESEATLTAALDTARALDAALPDGLGLAYACGARVYPGTPLAARLGPGAPLFTVDGAPPDPTFVAPVVHCRLGPPRALFARVQAALAGMKGAVGPMNAAVPGELAAEALVTRGLLRLHAGRDGDAAVCFEEALGHVPAHREALAQLAQVRANRLGDRAGAREALTRLRATLPEQDPGREEIEAALAALL
ncbi:MAG: radical SAM protein, partial [Pseudomonadota bacterium]